MACTVSRFGVLSSFHTVDKDDSEEIGKPDSLELDLATWGFTVSGRTTRPHRDDRLGNRVLWIDA